MRTDSLLRLALVAVILTATPTVQARAQEAGRAVDGQPAPAGAEAAPPEPQALPLIDPESTVGDVGFRFTSGSALEEGRLRRDIAYNGPGALAGLRRVLDFLPGVSAPERETFSPLTLQRDVVRLRRAYQRAGFADVAVDYEIAVDTAEQRVDVTFVIDQGQPMLIDSVAVALIGDPGDTTTDPAPDAPTPSLPAELDPAWNEHRRWLGTARGDRYGDQERARLQTETADWFLERGYPWVSVRIAHADTTDYAVDVRLEVAPGPRARVDAIEFEGQRRLTERVLAREIPIETGDWYDATAVTAGERELYELDLIRRALGGAPRDQPRDSTVSLRFSVDESRPRLVSGRVGWRSEGGVAGEAHWSHRDFLGGARTLTTSVVAETGLGTLETVNGRSAGVSASLRQPYVWHHRLAATVGPFVRVRDDVRDRSILFGIETALIYRAGPFQTVTLQHELSRFGVDQAFQLLPVRELVESGSRSFDRWYLKSVFKLSAAYGRVDNLLDPRTGFLLEPSLEVSDPTGASDIEFFRIGMRGMAALPLARGVGLYVRASAGRLFPFGDSDPESASTTRAFVGLRDLMFTAGGTSSVRGWASGALGPKIPQAKVGAGGAVTSDHYIPVGGLARLTASVELALPFPLLPPAHRTFVFFDSGRIWTPGSHFQPEDPELALEPWGHAVGGGIQIATPVGPVRVGVGYKLNPTRIDLLSPQQVAQTLAVGGDLSALPTHDLRRWHLHVAIGRGL